MLKGLFCVKKRRQRSGAGAPRKTLLASAHPSLTGAENNVLLAGLFHPLKTRRDVLRCSMGKAKANMEDIFCFQKRIGRGGFSEVWLAQYQNKPKEDPVAIKLMSKSLVSCTTVVNEMAVLKATHNCPFVVQMTNSFQTPTHYAIVMKYATGGTLRERVNMVRRFSELIARVYGAEIAEGLFNLHNRGVIHRDLNLDNVLIGENGHVVLSDFGLSLLHDSEDINMVWDPWPEAANTQFPAPELLLGLDYDKTVDWWSFGILMYRMVCGEYPFSRSKDFKKESHCLEMIYRKETYPSYLSSQAKSLISLLLARRRTLRLGRGPYEENDVTNMDFFYNVDWCQLRDHVLPAPFSDLLVQHGQQRAKRVSIHLPTSHFAVPTPGTTHPSLTGREGGV